MDTIILGIIGFAVVLIAVFLVSLLMEVRRTMESLRRTTEEKLNPAIDELQATLKSIRGISDNVNLITEDVRKFSGAVHEVGRNISAVNAMVNAFSSSLAIKTLGMKAGISAAISFFIGYLTRKGDRT